MGNALGLGQVLTGRAPIERDQDEGFLPPHLLGERVFVLHSADQGDVAVQVVEEETENLE